MARSNMLRVGSVSRWAGVGIFALLLFVGINLRAPLLSVPPLLGMIRSDLHLNYAETGLLSALPSLVMGAGAWPAGRLVGRIGGRMSVSLGLGLVALGVVARGLWPGVIAIYVYTAALAGGIAIAQTAIPLLTREWFPTRIGFVSAIYTDGLVIGEALAAAVTVPLMRAWFGDNAWPAALLIWAVPATVALILWMWIAPAASAHATPAGDTAHNSDVRRAEAASTRRVGPLLIGTIMAGGSVVYFGMNGWVAPYNDAMHASAMTPAALFAINAAQLPVCIGLTFVAQQVVGKRWPFVISGSVAFVAIVGWLVTPTAFEPLWGAMIGGAAAGVFTLAFALPAIFGHGAQVARLTGGSLGLSYTATFLVPYFGGVLWDTFHQPWLAFAPVALAAISLVGSALLLPPSSPQTLDDSTPFVEVAN
ncbi:MAG TPA: MFS transporter [Ktedonobacterales bacterium]